MRIGLQVGLLFSPVAALMAFVISYSEYSRHFPDRREPLRLSLQTAAVAWILFMLVGVGGGWFVERFVVLR